MPYRGTNVNYTIPEFKENLAKIDVGSLKNICDIISTNINEMNGIIAVWDNPDKHATTKDKRLPGAGTTVVAAIAAIKQALSSSNKTVTVAEINQMLTQFNTLKGLVDTKFNNMNYSETPNGVTGEQIDLTLIQHLATNLATISTSLDTKNSWWDSKDVCARSCQVSCQTGCQVACQGCITAQCHNQNCGGWS